MQSKKKIHIDSDIQIFIDTSQAPTSTSNRFEFRYFTNDRNHYVSCGFNGTKHINCYKVEGGLMAVWKCPGFYPGGLKVLRYFYNPNEHIDSGIFNDISAEMTDIEIADGFIPFKERQNNLTDYLKGNEGPQGPQGPQEPQGVKGDKGDIDKSYTDSKILALQIGGTNLFPLTSYESVNVTGYSMYMFTDEAISGKTLTISAIIDSPIDGYCELHPKVAGSNEYIWADGKAIIIRFKMGRNIIINQLNVPLDVIGYRLVVPNNMGIIGISRLKIEIGNKPTDWSPAPSDKLNIAGDCSQLKVALANNSVVNLIVNGKINPALL